MPHKTYLTDLGASAGDFAANDGSVLHLARYASWQHTGRKFEVVETSDDLVALAAKYGVSVADVVPIAPPTRKT